MCHAVKPFMPTKRGLTEITQSDMKPREFFCLVRNMRDKQNEYFRTRDRNVLVKSKALEKEVDDEIVRAEEILRQRGETI